MQHSLNTVQHLQVDAKIKTRETTTLQLPGNKTNRHSNPKSRVQKFPGGKQRRDINSSIKHNTKINCVPDSYSDELATFQSEGNLSNVPLLWTNYQGIGGVT